MKNVEINGIKFGELTVQEFIEVKKHLDGQNTPTIKYVPYPITNPYYPIQPYYTYDKITINPNTITCGSFTSSTSNDFASISSNGSFFQNKLVSN